MLPRGSIFLELSENLAYFVTVSGVSARTTLIPAMCRVDIQQLLVHAQWLGLPAVRQWGFLA